MRPPRHRQYRWIYVLPALLVSLCASLYAQSIDDGIMLTKHTVFSGVMYSHDSWDQYWEGPLERTNGNLGTVTTNSVMFTGDYGLTKRLNVLGEVPLIWTKASAGVLHPQSGFQDLTLAAKYNAFNFPVGQNWIVHGIGVVSGSVPLTNYPVDLLPLSIGTHSKRVALRPTFSAQSKRGLYINTSAAYTWRSNVTLDRSSYFTNNTLYLTNQVGMPSVTNFNASVGYYHHNRQLTADYYQQRTRGGGDIRRQDNPFVSNRVDYTRAGVTAMTPFPWHPLHDVCLMFLYDRTFDGRNVGQSSTYTPAVMYNFTFEHKRKK
jgi:hypothetical protein